MNNTYEEHIDQIHLHRMHFYGKHGVFPEERKLGQRFIIDLSLSIDLKPSGISDDLRDTINYADVYSLVKTIVQDKSFHLLECLAENIASSVLDTYTKVSAVRVKVTKPHPPFDAHFDGVTMEINRRRIESNAD